MTLPNLERLARYAPAASLLALGLAVLLAVQVGVQLSTVRDLRRDVEAQEAALGDRRGKLATNGGVAVAAPAQRLEAEATTLMRRQGTASGLKIASLAVVETRPAGPGRRWIQLRLTATGPAAAVDSLARWMQAHPGAVRLDRLDMTTLPEGGGVAQVEADIAVLGALQGSAGE